LLLTIGIQLCRRAPHGAGDLGEIRDELRALVVGEVAR
jgi:hypothetical protein